MINAGKELRDAFLEIFDTMGSQVIIHKDYGCSNANSTEIKGLKNHDKYDRSKVMFQFPETIGIESGDIIQEKSTENYWKVTSTEDRIKVNVFQCFVAYVFKISTKY